MTKEQLKNEASALIDEAYQQGLSDGKKTISTVSKPVPPQGVQPPAPSAPPQANEKGKLLYKIGAFSDVHFDNDEGANPSYYLEDFKQALQYWKEQGVDLLCSCGDMVWNKEEELQRLYDTYKANIGVPLYACKGNHDMLLPAGAWERLMIPADARTLDDGYDESKTTARITMIIFNDTDKEIVLQDKVNFVLANPDRNGNYCGWDGEYNRIESTINGKGENIIIAAESWHAFTIRVKELVGRNLLHGSKTGTNDCEHASNVMLYDENGISQNVPVRNANADEVFGANNTLALHIGGNEPSLLVRDCGSDASKASYYVERENTIIVMLSPYLIDSLGKYDSKTHVVMNHSDVSSLMSQISEEYMELHNLNSDRLRNKASDNFNYQFYQTADLLALERLLAENDDKRVLIFTHYYFPHKCGNNSPARVGCYAHSVHGAAAPYVAPVGGVVNSDIYDNVGAIVPHNEGQWWDKTDALCGIQLHYLNHLCNSYPNSVWFSGHSHISFHCDSEDEEMNVCRSDYPINEPSADVRTIKNADGTIIIENYDANIYMASSRSRLNVDCGTAVHLPSLSRPVIIDCDKHCNDFEGAEGAIVEVYEKGITISYVDFKSGTIKEYDL